METYEVTDPTSGVTLELTGDSPPTESELEAVFKAYKPPEPSVAEKSVAAINTPLTPAPEAPASIPGQAADMVTRLAKGTVSSLTPTSVEGASDMLTDPRAGKAGILKFLEEEAAKVQGAVSASKGTGPVVDLAAPMLRPSAWQESLGFEGVMMSGGALKDAAKAGLHVSAGRWATNMARRALGYTKSFFKNPEDFQRAQDVAQEMLKQTVKDPETGKIVNVFTPSTQSMLQRAEILSEQAGKKIGSILDNLDEAGVRSTNLDDLVNKVVTELSPGKSGGVYDKTRAIVKEVVDTINAHADDLDEAGNLTFKSAQQLKQTLKEIAGFNKETDAAKAHIFRRAYGIVREAIDNSVGNAEKVLGPKGTNILKEYIESKGIYGKAEEALGALTNKLGTELGNNLAGLRETIIAAGQLAKGNILAAAAAGGSKTFTQRGAALAAKVAQGLQKFLKTVPPSNRANMIKTLVNAGLLTDARKYYNEFSSRGVNLPKEPVKKKVDALNKSQAYYDNPVLQFGEQALAPLGNRLKQDIEDPMSMVLAQQEYLNKDPVELAMNFAGHGTGAIAGMAEFKGLKKITAPILERLKGKEVVSKQFIEDAIKMPGVKQVEQDIVKKILSGFEGDKVDANQFAQIMKGEFLPLKPVTVDKFHRQADYHSYNVPEKQRGPVTNYNEIIYESPIKTSAGEVHFTVMPDFDGMQTGAKETTPKNYFAHVRTEDVTSDKVIGHATVDGEKIPLQSTKASGTRRVLEIQSDLFQKGNLEKELQVPGRKAYEEDFIAAQRKTDRANEIAKLQPFRNTWHERIIQEEIRRAAKDGKTTLQFPTGETAMKIEKLAGAGQKWTIGEIGRYTRPASIEDLVAGKQLRDANGTIWVVLGGEKDFPGAEIPLEDFLALPLHHFKAIQRQLEREGMPHDKIATLERAMDEDVFIERFSIASKVNKEHPIYKFYEQDVQKVLRKLAPDVSKIKDPQGVTWFQMKVDPKKAKQPVFNIGTPQLVAPK